MMKTEKELKGYKFTEEYEMMNYEENILNKEEWKRKQEETRLRNEEKLRKQIEKEEAHQRNLEKSYAKQELALNKQNAKTVEKVCGSKQYRKVLWQYKHYKRAFNL